jgi:hypothetical protein
VYFSPALVYCTKKNLATLIQIKTPFAIRRLKKYFITILNTLARKNFNGYYLENVLQYLKSSVNWPGKQQSIKMCTQWVVKKIPGEK